MMGQLRVAIVDAHKLLREMLARHFTAHTELLPLPLASPREFLNQAASGSIDVALLEPILDPASDDLEAGFELLARACAEFPSMRTVVLTRAPGRAPIERAYRAGAMGFHFKPATPARELAEAVRAAARGERRFPLELMEGFSTLGAAPGPQFPPELASLTDRERDVLAQLAAGHDNARIGALLGISERTVKSHVAAIYRKMHVENRVQLALRAREAGLAAHQPALPGPRT